jgi:F-type H+-transporting ATPase subunit gamma
MARDLKRDGKTLKILCVGRKGRDQMRREFAQEIIGSLEGVGKPKLKFEAADQIARRIRQMFEHGEFDVCTVVYNKFKSAMTQIVTAQQLIPFAIAGAANENADTGDASYEYEPEEDAILEELLPRNIGMQVYRALLENAASEEGARMSAMDSATRNAGDMINRLTITYNRSRQAYITKELIEIISGAEAL